VVRLVLGVGFGVAALIGTLGQALEARDIEGHEDRLRAEAEADVEVADGIMVMRRITVRYRLRLADRDRREAAERAHAHQVRACGAAGR
jgi:hypothetical protein